MFENVINFFKNLGKKEDKKQTQSESSKDAAKERLHLVLMQDRANVSADFLELMKQEIIDVIKKYIEVDEKEIDVRLTNKENEDGTNGAPALYANIPILNIKNDTRKITKKDIENKKNEKEQNEEIEQHEEEKIKQHDDEKTKNSKDIEKMEEEINSKEEKNKVEKDDVLAYIYANDKEKLENAQEKLIDIIKINDFIQEKTKIVEEVLT